MSGDAEPGHNSTGTKSPGLIRVAGSRLSQLNWNNSSNDFEYPPGPQPWICIT